MSESADRSDDHSDGFWGWFFSGRNRSGWRKFLDRWLVVHAGVGVVMAYVVPGDLKTAASTVLLPLVGVLIGLSFAWAGNAQALLQTEEIEQLSDYRSGGFEEYVYTYQSAILVILASVVLWGVAGLGVFDLSCFWRCPAESYFAAKSFLYFFSSVTLRECWHVVLGAQMMLLARRRIRRSQKKYIERKES
jgi:hypothetical protein